MRKRLTEIMPFLLPIRIWQKNIFYRLGMFFDSNTYAKKKGSLLPFSVSKSKTLMINEQSGHDIIYQKNKVHNLKVVSKTMDMIYIYPGETFSFYYLSRKSKNYGKLKKGLIMVNGKIVAKRGGGICHLSNLLYYVFLQSPLTIIERHGHGVKSFPNPDKNSLDGVDATINEGWLDLRVKNNTDSIYQILISFEQDYMVATLLSNKESNVDYVIKNDNVDYFRKGEKLFKSVDVMKEVVDKKTNKTIEMKKLYTEIIEIEYEISEIVKGRY